MERVFRLQPPAAHSSGKGTNLQGFFTFFKSMFGAGILVLTHKFSDVGLPLGIIIFVAVAFFVVVTTYMLLDCHVHCSAIAGTELKSFEDLAGFILGKYGRRTIRYSIALLQLLFCTGFMIVFCDNMQDVFPALNRAEYAGLALLPLTLLSWIPSMKDMWVISVLGLVVYLIGVVGLSTYDGAVNYERPDGLLDWKVGGAASFFGVCAYSIEGICLVIPTAITLKKQEDSMFVITVGIVLYVAITLAFATFTFSAGLGDCDSVVECLDKGFLTTGVRLALCGALLLTHPVFIIVVANIVEGRMFRNDYSPLVEVDELSYSSKREASKKSPSMGIGFDTSPRSLRVKAIRFVLVGITCGIAASGISFAIFSGLVGSVLTSFIGFVMPAVMWWQLYRVVGVEGLSCEADEEDNMAAPLLPGTPEQSQNYISASAATGGPKSSLFTLLSPSSSVGASGQSQDIGIFNRPMTPSETSTEDPGRDWVYSSFIAEQVAGEQKKHDVILKPPPLVKSESDISGFLKRSDSNDDSSVDSREFSGRPVGARRSQFTGSDRHSWFGKIFDWSSSGHNAHVRGAIDTRSSRDLSVERPMTPDSRKSSAEPFSTSNLRSADGSCRTRESIYEYESEVREPSNAARRYRLPALSLLGHVTAVFFVVLGVVAMIAGGISGVQELVHGE